MITHHPGEALLLDYVTGALPEAPSLAVACHIAMCPACRAESARLEEIGGAALGGIEPAAVGDGLLERTLGMLDSIKSEKPARRAPVADGQALPYPLRSYVPGGPEKLSWRQRMKAVETADLDVGTADFTTRLIRIAPGMAVPDHSHRGNELTLVLSGGFTDATGHYGRGDFQVADGSTDHRPTADPDDVCLCLTVLDAPMRLTGKMSRFVDPFFRL